MSQRNRHRLVLGALVLGVLAPPAVAAIAISPDGSRAYVVNGK